MAARAAAFADPEVIKLASSQFLPLAENCSPLQTQKDAKGEFFRLVAEQGHYAGRTVPSATRQGQYAFTADGTLLSSINTRDADKMLGMMRQALERWHELRAETAASRVEAGAYERDPRYPDFYPADGLVLKQSLRDLPRPEGHASPQVRPEAINFDYAWFTKDEARDFLPERLEAGATRELPRRIVRRLARWHLLDSVRGETPPWRDEHVKSAHLSTEVTAVDGDKIHLLLTGAVRNEQEGSWAIRPFREKIEGMSRGYDCRLRGELTYDTATERFARFDLAAAGDRWGGTEHNNRQEDLPSSPMGIVFQLASDAPADRTPPHANLWDYFDIPPDQRPK
ncbi:MAG TPA: hypothetical protein VFX49_01490 [Chloroflexota bacterium]|nr:hypothetical protein [Chloroflexota bacterium]